MVKKRLLLVLFLLIIPISYANQVNYNQYSELDLKFELASKFYIQTKSTNYDIEHVTADIYFFPKDSPMQQVLSLNTVSEPAIDAKKEGIIEFSWKDTTATQFSYGVNSKIKTKNILTKIPDKIKYPADIIGYELYTKPTEKIDINDDIRNQANQIAQGEDDYYKVVFKVADWIETNIKYDLSASTSDVVQKSSWVMINKEGVCDELTSLFISMLRSLGIPARFIYGMAYSNINNEWGAHAWAEVYFPNKGWVPFDITYGQFGWIDPTHIRLMESADSNDPSVKYNWKSYNVDFINDKILLSTSLENKGVLIVPLAELRIKPLKDGIGPGSYVPIQVSIKNLNDFYLPESLYILKAPELNNGNVKRILLRPFEEKTVYWIAKVPENLESDYEYKSLLEVQDTFHTKASGEIRYTLNSPIISKNTAESLVTSLDIEEEKTYSKDVSLDCSIPKSYIYIYEEISSTCLIKNKGTMPLAGISVCFKEDCQNTDLGLGETKSFSFSIKNLPVSTTKLKFSAKNDELEINDYVGLNVLNTPELEVMNFEPPITLDYNEAKNLEFTLSAKAPIKNLVIKLNGNEIYQFEEFVSPQNIIISSSGKEFAVDDEIKLYFGFYDENKKFYSKTDNYPIQINNSPFYIRMIKGIKNLF